jgi:cardiolipin synthase A/B
MTAVGPADAARRVRFTTRPLVYGGNRIGLLKNGSEYFPRLLAAIERRNALGSSGNLHLRARCGRRARRRCAGRRGARGLEVRLLVDGFGADDTAPA